MADVKFLSWDSEITQDAPEFILLPEGDYPFMVQDLEKSIYDGNSEKIGKGCPMATLKIVVDGGELGKTSVTDRLYLNQSMEWKLGTFFRCIGQKAHGKSYKMDWNNVIGKQGLAHVKVETWTGNDGQLKKSNKIDRYLECDAAKAPTKPDMSDMPFEV